MRGANLFWRWASPIAASFVFQRFQIAEDPIKEDQVRRPNLLAHRPNRVESGKKKSGEGLKLLDESVLRHDAGLRLFDLTVFHENEGRHSADSELHCDVALVHNVHFSYFGGLADFSGYLVENRSEHFTGTAVLRPEVDNDRNGCALRLGGEVVSGKIYDGFVSHGDLRNSVQEGLLRHHS